MPTGVDLASLVQSRHTVAYNCNLIYLPTVNREESGNGDGELLERHDDHSFERYDGWPYDDDDDDEKDDDNEGPTKCQM